MGIAIIRLNSFTDSLPCGAFLPLLGSQQLSEIYERLLRFKLNSIFCKRTATATTANCKQQSFLCSVDSCTFFMAIAHFLAFFFRAEMEFFLLLPTLFSLASFSRGVKGVEWVCRQLSCFQLFVEFSRLPDLSQKTKCLPAKRRKR